MKYALNMSIACFDLVCTIHIKKAEWLLEETHSMKRKKIEI